MRKVHNDDDYGHGGEQRTYALAQKEFPALGITRSDVKKFIKYCVACQKRSFNKFDVPHQPIEDRLLNLMIADVWIIGEVHEKEKLAFLAVMDLKSRYVFLEELGDMSSHETATKLLKIGSMLNFKECILRTDPGTNFIGKEVQDVLCVVGGKLE